MRSQPDPRAAWPSSDDYTGFNLIVILLGCGFGAWLLWISCRSEISAAVISLRHHEIAVIQLFTDHYDLADRQMLAGRSGSCHIARSLPNQPYGREAFSHPGSSFDDAARRGLRDAGGAGEVQACL